MSVAGLLVCWNESYFANSIDIFVRLTKSVCKKSRAIVIVNNPLLPNCEILYPDVIFLRGTNTLNEFSGWDEGIAFLRAHGFTPKLVLFANDTFCHHRRWTKGDSLIFSMLLRHQYFHSSCPSISGLTCTPRTKLAIDHVQLPFWISTFMFGISWSALESLAWSLSPSNSWLNSRIVGGSNVGNFFGPSLSDEWRSYLSTWLFSPQGQWRWHNAEPLSVENQSAMTIKAKTILSEKRLSSIFVSNHWDFFVFQNFWLRRFIKWLNSRFVSARLPFLVIDCL